MRASPLAPPSLPLSLPLLLLRLLLRVGGLVIVLLVIDRGRASEAVAAATWRFPLHGAVFLPHDERVRSSGRR